jgi:hypothetical protein
MSSLVLSLHVSRDAASVADGHSLGASPVADSGPGHAASAREPLLAMCGPHPSSPCVRRDVGSNVFRSLLRFFLLRSSSYCTPLRAKVTVPSAADPVPPENGFWL